jgi:pheromone shutdown-related protein TraB
MQALDNVVRIIGTSHIAKESIETIRSSFSSFQPDIVAVELDLQRAAALLKEHDKGQKNGLSLLNIFEVGFKGYLFAKLGQYVQQKLGKTVGISPGSDMKTALELARKEKKEVAFIDQPINQTLKRFSKNLTWKEPLHFLSDLFTGIFFPKKQLQRLGNYGFDLNKVPKKELISKMIEEVKKRYPSIYRTLITERNQYMVKKLVQLIRKNPNKRILVIVGAGHEEGMRELLLKVEIFRTSPG